MKNPMVLTLCVVALLGTPFHLAHSQTTRLGGSTSALDRFDITRPAERAQLMSERNADLLHEGVVDAETYILGPGDLLGFEIPGTFNVSSEDVVGADGYVTFPQIGTFQVGGISLSEARRLITGKSESMLRGAEPVLLLKSMRTFKVQVLGQVAQVGAQSASPTTRVSEVIQAGGGFTQNADYRNIQVIHRNGSTDRADLLQFLIAGRFDTNPRVEDGDVVLVQARTEVIEILGALVHPGRYDHVEGDELGELLEILGLHPKADRGWAVLQRYRDGVHWDTLSVDLRSVLDGVSRVPLQAGDRVMIRAVGEWRIEAVAYVNGAVRYPGPVPVARSGVTIRDAIDLAGGPLEDATLERVVLGRPFLPDSTSSPERNPTDQFVQGITRQWLHEVVVDLGGGASGPLVHPGDRITVPRLEAWVEVLGQVANPGFYDHHEGWEAKDYIKAAGGYASYADGKKTQVSRGRFGDVSYALDMGPLAPGDIIWVPEKQPVKFWTIFKDALAVTSQAAAIIIIVRDATR